MNQLILLPPTGNQAQNGVSYSLLHTFLCTCVRALILLILLWPGGYLAAQDATFSVNTKLFSVYADSSGDCDDDEAANANFSGEYVVQGSVQWDAGTQSTTPVLLQNYYLQPDLGDLINEDLVGGVFTFSEAAPFDFRSDCVELNFTNLETWEHDKDPLFSFDDGDRGCWDNDDFYQQQAITQSVRDFNGPNDAGVYFSSLSADATDELRMTLTSTFERNSLLTGIAMVNTDGSFVSTDLCDGGLAIIQAQVRPGYTGFELQWERSGNNGASWELVAISSVPSEGVAPQGIVLDGTGLRTQFNNNETYRVKAFYRGSPCLDASEDDYLLTSDLMLSFLPNFSEPENINVTIEPACFGLADPNGSISLGLLPGVAASALVTYTLVDGTGLPVESLNTTAAAGGTFAGLVGDVYGLQIEVNNGSELPCNSFLSGLFVPDIPQPFNPFLFFEQPGASCGATTLTATAFSALTLVGPGEQLTYRLYQGELNGNALVATVTVPYDESPVFTDLLPETPYFFEVEAAGGCLATSTVVTGPELATIPAFTAFSVSEGCPEEDLRRIELQVLNDQGRNLTYLAQVFTADDTQLLTLGLEGSTPAFTLINDSQISLADLPLRVKVINGATFCEREEIIAYSPTPQNVFAAGSVLSNPTTCSDFNGSVAVVANNGTPPYTFVTSRGNVNTTTNPDSVVVTDLGVGNTLVFVTDANGCSFGFDFDLFNIDATPLELTTPSLVFTSCAGAADGVITATASGGTGAYQYRILEINPTYGASATFTGLPAGRYTVQVQDINTLCETTNIVDVIDATQPKAIGADFQAGFCPDDAYTVRLQLDPPGGFGFYLFGDVNVAPNCILLTSLRISTNGGATYQNYGTGSFDFLPLNFCGNTAYLSLPLVRGDYDIRVQTADGCGGSIPFLIQSADFPTDNIAFVNEVVVNDPGCSNQTGSLTVNFQGGVDRSQLTLYRFTGGDNIAPVATSPYLSGQTTAYTFNNVPISNIVSSADGDHNGGYVVLLETGYFFQNIGGNIIWSQRPTIGCDVFAPDGFNTGASFVQYEVVAGNTPPTGEFSWVSETYFCNGSGAEVLLSATGGQPPYTFSLNGGAFTSQEQYLLSATSFSFRVMDANGCVSPEISGTAGGPEIDQFTSAEAELVRGVAACGELGVVDISLVGGVSPFSVSIRGFGNSGGYNQDYTLTGQDTTVLIPLFETFGNQGPGPAMPGRYLHELFVQDANGCEKFEIFEIFVLGDPFVLAFPTNESCRGAADGTLSVEVNPEDLGSIDIDLPPATEFRNAFLNGVEYTENPFTATNLSAGTYTLLVFDDRGCVQELMVNIGLGNEIQANLMVTDNGPCAEDNSGAITVTPSGGTAPYGIELLGQGSQSAAEGQSITFNNLQGNDYIINIVDAEGCTQEVNTLVGGPQAFSVTLSGQTNPTCSGLDDGSLSFVVVGGSKPLQLSLDGGPSQELFTFTDLAAGTYNTLDVTDANGCSFSFALGGGAGAVLVNQSSVTATFSVTPVACVGEATGKVQLLPAGGAEPYTFSVDGTDFQPGDTFSGLSAGTYSFVVRDNLGCTTSLENVIVTEPSSPLTAMLDITNVDCNGASNGTISIAAAGGTSPYTYALNGMAPVTVATFLNLPADFYDIVVTDNVGCSFTFTNVELTEPETLGGTTDFTAPVCAGGNDGQAAAIPSGGTAPYQYRLFGLPGGPTAYGPDSVFTNLPTGSYALRWQDVNGCESAPITVILPDGPAFDLQLDNTSPATCGEDNGTASVSAAEGGQGTISFSWTGGLSGATQSNLAPGTYGVTATDEAGCTAGITVVIEDQPAPMILERVSISSGCSTESTEGEAAVVVFGGQPPYNFNWSPGTTDSLQTGLVAGRYFVTVTDQNGCVITDSVDVEAFPSINVNTSSTPDTCDNVNGTILLDISGGSGDFTIVWNPGVLGDGPTYTNLSSGNYAFTLTDRETGCTESGAIEVTAITGPAGFNAFINTPTTCGEDNGSLALEVFGGADPLSYTWSHDAQATEPTQTGLAAGSYTVTVTDNNGCSLEETFIVGGSSALSGIILAQTDATCDQANGSATLAIGNGTGNLTYTWGLPAEPNGPTATNLPAGTYNVLVMDETGCSVTVTVTIDNLPPPAVTVTLAIDPICFEGTGEINVSALGGNGALTYRWSHDASLNSPSATGLNSGEYFVTVEDATGCSSIVSTTLQPPNQPSFDAPILMNPNCGQANGQAELPISGGTGALSYRWSHDPGLMTNATVGLPAGAYSVTVTDGLGCTDEITIFLNDQPGPTGINAFTNEPTTCGEANGVIAVEVFGGSDPLSYAWSHSPLETAPTVTDLAAGDYTVTVTDANGCLLTQDFTVAASATPTGTITSSTDVSCNQTNGEATVVTTGLAVPLTYVWGISNEPNGPTANNLAAGTYTVTVTGNNGCSTTATVLINNTDGPSISEVTAIDPVCTEGTGMITVLVTGGTEPYTYDWSITDAPNSGVLTDLAAGTYALTVTDATGCSITFNQTLVPPAPPVFLAPSTSPSTCGRANGSIALNRIAGMAPFTYSWSHSVAVAGPEATNLSAGVYTVTVTDDLGCTDEQSITLEDIPGPMAINDFINTPTTCGEANGVLAIEVVGGTNPLSYAWSHDVEAIDPTQEALTAGVYTVTVTDANGCTLEESFTVGASNALTVALISQTDATCGEANGSATVDVTNATGALTYVWGVDPEPNGPTAMGLAAGEYTVLIMDEAGCATSVDVMIGRVTPPILALVTAVDPDCDAANGSIEVAPSGGIPPYTFSWSHATDLDAPLAEGLPSGDYNVTVTDITGCMVTLSRTLVNPEAPVLGEAVVVDVNCNGTLGSISFPVSGGQGMLNYQWSHTSGLDAPLATDLVAGTYQLTVTDANGCSDVRMATVNGQEGPTTVTAVSLVATTCGIDNGRLSIQVDGGAAPYAYVWQPAVGNGPDLENLAAGTYAVTVTDANGCTQDASFLVEGSPALLSDGFTVIAASCGEANGSATIMSTGGTGALSYVWGIDPEPNSATVTGLAVGEYAVVVMDEEGCTFTETVEITGTDEIVITPTVTDASCVASDGAISLAVTGGTSPYMYSWSGRPETTNTITGLAAGTYAVTVTGNEGCSASTMIEIIGVGADIQVFENSAVTPVCAGGADGALEVFALGGTNTFTYRWSNGREGAAINNLMAGAYTVTATDGNGCSAILELVLTDGAGTVFDYPTADTTLCAGDLLAVDLSAFSTVLVTGNNGFNSVDPVSIIDAAGTYNLMITDVNGCSGEDELSVSFSDTPLTAGLVVPTDVVLGDTVVVLETSFPVPDNVSWFFDQNQVTLLSQTGNQYRFLFENTGTYTLGMIANGNGCEDVITKQIIVHADSMSIGGGPLGRLEIRQITVAPNPNQGQFAASVRTSANLPVAFMLYDIDGNLLDTQNSPAGLDHEAVYDLDLVGGTYLLSVQTAAQRRTQTILVIR